MDRRALEVYARRVRHDRETNPLRLMHPRQLAVAASKSKSVALVCGRRSGKTWTLLLLLIAAMRRWPGSVVPYIALTRESARNILWGEAKRVASQLGLPLVFGEARLEIVDSGSGSRIVLRGANKLDELEKLRGAHPPIAVIDEAASFRPSLLQSLAEDVLEPALLDCDGTLYLAGSPGAACAGYFHAATTGAIPGWDVHHWTVLDNPAIPHAAAWLDRKRAQKGWSEDNPTYRREYLGQWVRDEDALVFKFRRDRNGIAVLPALARPGRILSHDYGYVDSTAWCVLQHELAQRGDRNTYVARSFARAGLSPGEAAAVTQQLREQHRPHIVVGDSGGLGKGYIEEYRRRYPGMSGIKAADKTEKRAFIELANDDLRSGRLQVLLSENSDLVEELETLQWDEDRKDVIGSDHLSDALLYGWRESHAHQNRAAPQDDDDDDDDAQETAWQSRMTPSRARSARQR